MDENGCADDELDEIPVGSYSDDPDSGPVDVGESAADDFNDEESTFQPSSRSRKQRRVPLIAGGIVVLAVLVLAFRIVRDSKVNRPLVNAMTFLVSHGISSAESFRDEESPQSMAANWIMHQDPLMLHLEDPGFVQRYVVATLAFAVTVNSPKSILLRNDMNFLSGYHECDWTAKWGKKEANTLLNMGIRCDSSRNVEKVIMPGLGLKGQLPRELGSLDYLNELVFDANEISGMIPYVSSLTSISMAYNYIEGKLPKFLGLMTDLEELVLTENLLSGSIPEEIQELTNLRRFSIGGNEIAGGIQYLFELTGLEEIYGGFNSLEDVFDNDSFGKLINLRVLDLKNNRLQGPFPSALWTLSKLQVVDFHYNALDGHLHEIEEEHFPVVEYLDVSVNFLSGGFPYTINKVKTLKYLDISTNRFDRPLLGDYGTLTSLTTLFMSDNSLFGPGPIPDWLKNLSNLEHLSLKLTGRTGIIPEWFFDNLTQLKTLDMDWNRISGNIPRNIGHATKLEHLLLNRNSLSGTVPTDLRVLTLLKTLMLDNNRLVGEIQSCQADVVVADCGDPSEGCPNCASETMEISCPCCTR
jgi:Leucine-rich repeat (LRR) protein